MYYALDLKLYFKVHLCHAQEYESVLVIFKNMEFYLMPHVHIAQLIRGDSSF